MLCAGCLGYDSDVKLFLLADKTKKRVASGPEDSSLGKCYILLSKPDMLKWSHPRETKTTFSVVWCCHGHSMAVSNSSMDVCQRDERNFLIAGDFALDFWGRCSIIFWRKGDSSIYRSRLLTNGVNVSLCDTIMFLILAVRFLQSRLSCCEIANWHVSRKAVFHRWCCVVLCALFWQMLPFSQQWSSAPDRKFCSSNLVDENMLFRNFGISRIWKRSYVVVVLTNEHYGSKKMQGLVDGIWNSCALSTPRLLEIYAEKSTLLLVRLFVVHDSEKREKIVKHCRCYFKAACQVIRESVVICGHCICCSVVDISSFGNSCAWNSWMFHTMW